MPNQVAQLWLLAVHTVRAVTRNAETCLNDALDALQRLKPDRSQSLRSVVAGKMSDELPGTSQDPNVELRQMYPWRRQENLVVRDRYGPLEWAIRAYRGLNQTRLPREPEELAGQWPGHAHGPPSGMGYLVHPGIATNPQSDPKTCSARPGRANDIALQIGLLCPRQLPIRAARFPEMNPQREDLSIKQERVAYEQSRASRGHRETRLPDCAGYSQHSGPGHARMR